MNGKDMAKNPKTWLASRLQKLTPQEISQLSKGLMILGICLIAKSVLDRWGGIPTCIIRGGLFVVMITLAFKAVQTAPLLKGYKPWFIPLGFGAFLNWGVVLANGGYMPSTCQDIPKGMYIPMSGSNVPYLGDWIFGFMSPGDVILFVAFAGLILTIVANGKKKKKAVA